MNSNNRCNTTVCASALLAVAALGFSPAAWSLGLGDVKVESYLNQPLQARIDLISQASDDLSSMTAQLASAADYELIGASREAVSVPIRFSIEEIDGDAYILATSNLPIADPVLRLIVEVSWSSGRMLREYTLFLDPPSVPEPAPAPRIDQRATPPAPAAGAEPRQVEAPAEREDAPDATPGATPVQPAAGSEYGPVRSGETLWAIASEWSRGSGMNINRVMIAIQRENPDAFLRDNINLLKRGAILRMPSAAEVSQVSAASAYQEVVAQEQGSRPAVISGQPGDAVAGRGERRRCDRRRTACGRSGGACGCLGRTCGSGARGAHCRAGCRGGAGRSRYSARSHFRIRPRTGSARTGAALGGQRSRQRLRLRF
jgi:pilus assembly protein FimV